MTASASGHATDERSLRYRGWHVALASSAALTLGPSTIAVLGLGLFMTSLEREFGWTRSEVALGTTIVSCMVVIVSPLQGWLIDRYGARRLILLSIPTFGLGVAALSLLPRNLGLFYLAWVALPLLGIGLFPLSYLKAVGGWFHERLGLALGLANAGVAIGSMLLPLLVGQLIGQYSWRVAYAVLGALVITVTLPVAWRFIEESDRSHGPAAGTHTAQAGAGVPFAEARRTRTTRLLLVSFGLMGTTTTAYVVHQVPLLVDRGMPLAIAALVQVTFGAFGLLGRLLTGLLLDRFRATRVMGSFLVGGALACAILAGDGPAGLAFVAAALFGLLFGAEFDVLAYVIRRRFGDRAFGRLYGLVFAVFQSGAVLGTLLLPLSRDRAESYSPGLAAFAVLLALAALAFGAIPDPVRLQGPADEPA